MLPHMPQASQVGLCQYSSRHWLLVVEGDTWYEQVAELAAMSTCEGDTLSSDSGEDVSLQTLGFHLGAFDPLTQLDPTL